MHTTSHSLLWQHRANQMEDFPFVMPCPPVRPLDALARKDAFHVVVLTSTVMPGSTGGAIKSRAGACQRQTLRHRFWALATARNLLPSAP